MEFDFSKFEHKILEFWKGNRIFEKLREKNRNKKRWSFLDGPITANNPMGVHHAWGRTDFKSALVFLDFLPSYVILKIAKGRQNY